MSTVREAVSAWFAPPRPHGETIPHRRVGFVELFLDLAFVVLVSQISHPLAEHPSWHAVWQYAVLFALVWFAWLNSTQYEDLHGRSDGRSRVYIFTQMGFLATLAVNAGSAPEDDTAGRYFALTYAALLLFLGSQWLYVMKVDDATIRPLIRRYVGILVAVAVLVGASAWISEPEVRFWVWTVAVIGALAANIVSLIGRRSSELFAMTMDGNAVTESGAERFGLYIIIVLGESVLGVVNGLIAADRSWLTVGTGLIALALGAALWWCYFDFVGMRLAHGRYARAFWYILHLPLSAAIAAVGAAMVGLVSHATEEHTPATTSWLLGGSLAAVLVCTALLMYCVPRTPGEGGVPIGLLGAAAYSLVISAIAPAPWLLVLLLLAGMTSVWGYAFVRAAGRDRLITGTPIGSQHAAPR